MRPDDLGARLIAHGFSYGGDDIGMAVPLEDLPASTSAPEALSIECVVDEQGLAAWTAVLGQSFGEGPREAEWVGTVFRRIGRAGDTTWRHDLGRLAGRPGATASLFLAADAAGISFVSTLPAARRQGIGAAMTLAAMRDGRAFGHSVAVLGASEAGFPVYRRLGFADYCRIAVYEWHPPSNATGG